MLEFCGQELCTLDANGRLKLSAQLLRDFERHSEGDLVLHYLTEGALGLYPPATWKSMRLQDEDAARKAGQSMLARRKMRRIGALTQRVQLTGQGRITIPPGLREKAALKPQLQVMLVGTGIGAEIWNLDRWNSELDVIEEHDARKGEQELNDDLVTGHE